MAEDMSSSTLEGHQCHGDMGAAVIAFWPGESCDCVAVRGDERRDPILGTTPAPRVLLPAPNCCLIRRTTFGLLGGLDPRFSHPRVLLADFAARGRELGLSCALAPDTVVIQSRAGLGPCPPDELERLHQDHAWLAAARADETALDADALKHALIANRARRQGMSVTIDARSLGSGFGGTQTYVGELLLALAHSGRVAVRAVLAVRPDPELAAALADAGGLWASLGGM